MKKPLARMLCVSLALCAALTLAACDTPAPAPSPSPTPAATPAPSATAAPAPKPTPTPPPSPTPEPTPTPAPIVLSGARVSLFAAFPYRSVALALEQSVNGLTGAQADIAQPVLRDDSARMNMVNRADGLALVAQCPGEKAPQQILAMEHPITFVDVSAAPIARDALVFLTGEGNSVATLTSAQLKDIYAGRATSWSAAGGSGDVLLFSPTDPKTSWSGRAVKAAFLGDEPMAGNAAQETLPADFVKSGTLIAMPYSYAVNDYAQTGFRMLAVDGIAPTAETIANGKYPFACDVYAVYRADTPQYAPARMTAEYLQSPPGQKFIASCGLVPYSR